MTSATEPSPGRLNTPTPGVRLGSPAEIGTLIRHRRKEMKLTQAELAGLAGVSHKFVNEVEQGRPPPGSARLWFSSRWSGSIFMAACADGRRSPSRLSRLAPDRRARVRCRRPHDLPLPHERSGFRPLAFPAASNRTLQRYQVPAVLRGPVAGRGGAAGGCGNPPPTGL